MPFSKKEDIPAIYYSPFRKIADDVVATTRQDGSEVRFEIKKESGYGEWKTTEMTPPMKAEHIKKGIHIQYHRNNHYMISVHESLSLKFRGDVYNLSVFGEMKKIQNEVIERSREPYKNVELLEDKYGRLWLLTCYHDFLAPSDMTYQLVKEERDGCALAASGYENITDRDDRFDGDARLPYFFASIYPGEDFSIILHDDPTEETPGYIESKRNEIIELNKQITR